MLHLHHSLSIHTNHLHNPSIFFLSHSSTSVSCSGLKRWDIIKNTRKRRKKFPLVEAVEKDSEFEVDQDKAREALRKLDEKLQSISQKKIDPPKIRATDLSRDSFQMTEENKDLSGSFLNSLAFGLLLFTIFYNILFVTVIKPAVDGPDSIPEIDLTLETLQAAPLQQLLSIPRVSK
ncbi:uncharacterized protein [Nicotiana sylvestris]|uniref:Uncharacterized protein LOC104218674 n=1 Tax=Nicotiana sylvestris TaxID=4096 RepID=A0A1U7VHG4_NICSY|nr:PREDICTED: uncharacterized protein LOC104218674 [Nicotiana sylvestris]